MKVLNKFILCAMDKSKTIEELKANYNAIKYSICKDGGTFCDITDAVLSCAASAAAQNHGAYEYWLVEYFTFSGDNRLDYLKELKKNESSKDIEAKIKIELKAAKTAVGLIRISLAVTPENYSGKVLKQLESINVILDDLRKETDAREDS